MTKDQTLTIDGKEYKLSELNDKAKADLASLQLVDRKIAEAQQQLAILQTARNAYALSLNGQLSQDKTLN